ncbi:MAG: PAS domain S-box protein [Chloroflexi bacterium]|nr:PAS domain S-box protein [Chloroflexota bacterium]
MSRFDELERQALAPLTNAEIIARMRRPIAVRYAIAVGSVLFALGISVALRTVFEPAPFTLFWLAVALSAWYGGMKPSLTATVLSALSVQYFFLATQNSLAVTATDLVRLGIFLAIALLVSALYEVHRLTEKALLLSRGQIEAILRSVADGITAQDQTGRVVFANDAAARIIGLNSREELLTAPAEQILQGFEILDENGELFPYDKLPGRLTLQGQNAPETVLRFRVRNTGEIRWSMVKATPVHDELGAVKLAINLFQDITHFKRSETALYEQREWLRVTLAGIGDGVIVTDTEARITFLNPVASSLTGWQLDEAVGQDIHTVFNIISEITGEPVESPITRVLREGVILNLENHTLLIAKDGTPRPIDDSGAPIYDAEGRNLGAVLVFRDVTARRAAEDRLRESEERFRIMADTAPVLIWVMDADRNLTYFNKPWLEFTGRTLEEALNDDWTVSVHPNDREPYRTAFEAACDARERFTTEYRLRCADGEYRWLLDTGVPRFEPDGTFVGYIGSCIDITERKQAEETDQFLAAIVSNSDDGIIGKMLDGTVLSWNQGAEAIYGYTAEEMIGEWIGKVFLPEKRHELDEIMGRIRDGLSVDRMETQRLRKDGRIIDISLTVSPIRNSRGEIIGASTIARDITERKRADEQLRYHAYLLQNASDAILATDRNFTIQSWNKAAESIYGWTADEVMGKPLSEVLQIEYVHQSREEASQQFIETGHWQGEQIHHRKDGSRFPVLISASLLRDENGEPDGLVSVQRDITERKQAERALSESEERFRQLTENIREVFWLRDVKSGRLLYISPIHIELWGLSPDQPLRHIEDFINTVHPDDYERIKAASKAHPEGGFDEEYRILRPDGTERWIYARSFPIYNRRGKVYRIAGVAEDITGRKHAEAMEREQRMLAEALRDTANLLNSTLDLSEVLDRILGNIERVVPHHAAEIVLIEDGGVRVVSSRDYWRRDDLTEETQSQSLSLSVDDVPNLHHMIETRQPMLIPDISASSDGVRLLRGQHWRSYVGAPIYAQDEFIGFINLMAAQPQFFTPVHADRLQAFAEQAAIAIRNAQLHQQEQTLAALQERQRLARDLHDAVSQTLFSASVVAEALTRQYHRNPEKVQERLIELHQLTRGALAEMRTLLLELRPASLVEVEIRDLLNQLAEALRSRKRIQIAIDVEGDFSALPMDVKLTLYRITQEALNNIAKHAHATHGTVTLRGHNSDFSLTVTDNGRGFDMESVMPTSLGLGIMRERAEAIGARLTITSAAQQGTQVVLAWSAEQREEARSIHLAS